MPTDNVLPIDEQSAQALTRNESRFRWFVAGITVVWLGVLIPSLLLTPLPPIGPFLVFAALVILAEHRFILFNDETSMSAGMLVAVAAVVTFSGVAPLVGSIATASLGALLLPHVRRRRISLMAANASIYGIAGFGAAIAFKILKDIGHGVFSQLLVVALTVLAYWIVNAALTGLGSSIRNNTGICDGIWRQQISDYPVLVLAIAVALVASLRRGSFGPFDAALLIVIVAILGLRLKRFSRQSQMPQSQLCDGRALLISVGCVLPCFVVGTATSVCIGVFALYATLVISEQSGRMALVSWVGIAIAAAAYGACTYAFPWPHSAISIAIALVGYMAHSGYELLYRYKALKIPADALTALGTLIPTRQDLGWIAATGFVLYVITIPNLLAGTLMTLVIVLSAALGHRVGGKYKI